MTLGRSLALMHAGRRRTRLGEASLLITEINLRTAIGTGINAHPDYAHVACRHLVRISGVPVVHWRIIW